MKVKELIATLETQDPEADVLLMLQSYVPWECKLERVAARRSFAQARESGTAPSDVFLMQGEQLRYGSPDVWRR